MMAHFPRHPPRPLKRLRARRKSLLLGCALGSWLPLAGYSGTAHAQAVPNATPTTTAGDVTYSRDSTPTPMAETITVNTPSAIINWTPTTTPSGTFDFLPKDHTLTFQVGGEQLTFAVLNRIITTVPSRFDGSVISRARDAQGAVVPGGTVLFSSPGGIIIGSTASFDVGNLVLTTLNVVDDGKGNFIDPNGLFQFDGGAANPNSSIITEAGSSIVANSENSYVALVSPVINHGGSTRVNGSVAYIAGEQVSFSVNQGLFDIVVGAGSDNAQPIVHTGSTGGPSSTGITGDNHGIYMVAVPKNQAVTMLLSGSAGFDAATDVNVVNGEIILSAGHNVTAGNIGSDAGSPLDADIAINGGTYSSDVTGRATHNAVATADSENPLTFTGSLSLQAGNFASVEAGLRGIVSVGGDLDLIADDLATGAPGTAQMQASSGGSITVGGDASLSADSAYDSIADGVGASSRGGTAAINAFGIVSIAGDATLSATATGEQGSNTGGNAVGGTASISAPGGAVFVGGNAELDSTGFGGSGLLVSGNGQGGTAFVSASNFGLISVAGALDVYAYGVGNANFFCGLKECSDPVTAGDGTGGTAFAGVQGGSTLNANSLFLDASGYGANGTDAGGDGVGGTATLTGDSNVNVGYAGVFAEGVGGSGLGSSGGSGTGGAASIIASPGATFTIDVEGEGSGDVEIFADGRGGSGISGGNGTGNTALLSADGATIDISGDLLMVANGYGGGDFEVGESDYSPGSGTGGTASLLASNGSTIDAAFGIEMYADGGSGTIFINGGTGLSCPASGCELFSVPSPSFFFFDVGPAGAGAGGKVDVTIRDSVLTTTDLFASVTGVGGGGSQDATGAGTSGFAGTGGDATIEFSSAGASSLDSLMVDVRGGGGLGGSALEASGGAGGNGGAGLGGSATLTVNSGQPALGQLTIAAGGYGGPGGNGGSDVRFNVPGGIGGAGGTGGSGSGGSAELVAGVGGIIVLDTYDLSVRGLGADGGTGGDGSDFAGTGGTGGSGLGGVVTLGTTGGQVQVVNSDGLFLQAQGVGGDGGAGGDNPLEGATGGTGGNAGDGKGGTAETDVAGGSITSPSGASATLDSNGFGGVGGAGGSAFNLGPAGASGNGAGGLSRISIADGNGAAGSASLGFVTLRSSGIGGDGFTSFLDGAGQTAFDDMATGAISLAALTALADGAASTAGPAFAFTSSGGAVQVTGDVLVDVSGDVTVNATGTGGLIAAGLLDIFSSGSIAIDHQSRDAGATLSGSDVDIDAGVDVFAGAGSLVAATAVDLSIRALSVDVGALSAAGNIFVSAGLPVLAVAATEAIVPVGSIAIDSAVAGTDIRLGADSDIDVGFAQAGDDFVASAGGTFTGGTIVTTGLGLDDDLRVGNGSNIAVQSAGQLQLDNGEAPDLIFLESTGGSIVSGDTLSAAGLTANAALDLHLNDVFVTSSLLLSATGGSIDGNSFNSDGDVDLDSATTIDVASVNAGGALTADAGGDVRIDNAVTGTSIALASTGGSVLSDGLLDAGTSLQVTAANGIDLNAVDAAGFVDLSSSAGGVDADAVTTTGSVFISSAGLTTLGTLTAGGSVSLSGDDLQLTSIVAGTDLNLSAGGDIGFGSLQAGDDVTANAGGTITGSNAVSTGLGFDDEIFSEVPLNPLLGSNIFMFAVGDLRLDNGNSATALLLASSQGRIFSSTLLQSGANIELDSAGDTIIASAASGDDFLADAGGAFTASNVTALVGSDIIVTSAGDLTLDNAEAVGLIQLQSTGGSIFSAGLLDAGTSLDLAAVANVDMNDGIAGTSISLSASGTSLDAGDLTSGQDIFASSSGTATIASATSGASIFVFASGAAQLGLFDAGGSLIVSAGSIQLDSGIAADDVDLRAGGDIAVTFAQAGDDFTANAGGAFTGSNVVTTGLGFDSETQSSESTFGGVGSNIEIDTIADARLDNGNTVGSLDINSLNGDVLSDGLLEAAGNFVVLAADNVDINDGTAGGFMQLEAETGSLDAGDLSAVGSLLAFADTDATIASADAAGILVSASGTADLGTLASSLEIRVSADDILLDSGTAVDDVDLSATGDIAVTFAQAGDDFTATGGAFTGGTIVTTGLGFDGETIGGIEGGSGGLGSNIIVHADNDVSLASGDSAGFIELLSNAGAITSSTLLEAVGTIDLDSFGDTTIASAEAGNDFLADSGGAFSAADVTAGDNITVTSAGDLALANADAVAAIQLSSTGGSVLSTGLLDAGSFLTVSAADNIDFNDATSIAFIDLSAGAGSLDAGSLTSDGTIFASAGTDVTLASANSGDSIFVSSGGTSDLGTLVANGSIFVSGAAIQLASATADEDVDLSADGDIAVTFAQAGDDFTASPGGTFSGGTVVTTGLGFDGDSESSEGGPTNLEGSNIVIHSTGDLRLDSGSAADRMELASIDGRVLSSTLLRAGDDVEIDSGGDTLIADAAAGNDFLADSGGVFTAAEVDAVNNVTIASVGTLTLADGEAGSAIQLVSSNGSVASSGTLRADRLEAQAGEDIALNDVIVVEELSLEAANGSITGNAFTSSDGDVLLDAGQEIGLGSASSGGTVTASAGGNLRLDNIVAPGAVELTSITGNLTSSGSIDTGSSVVASAAGSGQFNNIAAASVDLDLGGAAAFTGAVVSPTISVASSDIEIGAGASIGGSETSLVSLTVQPGSGQTVLGGTSEGPGYTLADPEADRIRAARLTIEAPAAGTAPDRAPDLLIRDLSFSASRTGQVEIVTPGIAQVEGELRLADAGAGNALALEATQRLQIATPGAVRVQDSSGMTDGSLEMRSNHIWAASAAVLQQLASDPDFAGRDAALLVNDGAVNPRGSIEAGDVTLHVGATLFVQNSGSVLDFAGITVRENTLTIVPTGSQPIQAYAFGRRVNPDGSYVTNNDFFREVDFVGRGSLYASDAQFNLCFINSGACRLPSPREPLPGGQDIVEEPIFNEEPTTSADTGVLPPAADSDTLVDTTFGSDPLIEEPVTSGGDSSLWDGDCDRDDDGDCDAEDLQ